MISFPRPSRPRTVPGRSGLPGGLARCMLTTVIVTAVVLGLLLASGPVHANPIPVATFDFATGPLDWVSTNVAYNNKPPAGSTWKWQSGAWRVEPVSVWSPLNWVGNELTSPRIVVPETVDALEFTMLHRFNFPVNISTGQPIVAGQVVYRIFDVANPNGPFLPLSPAVFATGSISPPLTPYPDWVPPNYTAPAALPPLVATGAGWKGVSPGFAARDFVATRWVIDGGLQAGQEVQVRFINANLGRECTGGLWEVSSVTVVGLLPEPSTLGFAGSAAGAILIASAAGRARQRRHQRASKPSVSPFTNTPPPVSVA